MQNTHAGARRRIDRSMVVVTRRLRGAARVPTILQRVSRAGLLLVLAGAAGTHIAWAQGLPEARRSSPDDDPFAKRGWHLELGGHYATEAWNYNISHEKLSALLSGLAYGLRSGLVLTARSSLYHVDQRGVDGLLLGASIGIRGRLFRGSSTSVFLELEVGVSDADTPVPPRGTRFNYLALGGGGATFRVKPGVHVLAGLRWVHVSNGGLAGRDRNPDIEAIGPTLGLLLAF